MKKLFLTLTLVLFVIPFGISQDVPSHIPTEGLVAYYPFNGNANDESGNGNNGTVNGATLSYNRNDDDNSAYDFQVLDWDSGNNGGNYIYIPHSSEFNFESFTLSAWVYRKSAGASNSPQHLTIMRKFEEGYNNPNGESWHFDIAHGTNNGGSILIGRVIEQSPSPATKFECASTNTIIEREWTHVIMTYSDKTIKTFINGVESCSSTNNNITLNTLGTSGISIGMSVQANGNWGPFDGSIDDIGIWNRALTEQEIQNLYSSSSGDILLNGTVSAENNQIKNLADPTDALDAATKNYVDSNVNSFSGSYNDLTDKPTSFSGDLSGNVTSNFLKLNPLTQAEIDNLNPEAGTIVFNADSEKFIGYSGSASQELDQSQENQNQLFDNPNTAQSFTAGSSGSLSKIDVKLSNGMYGQPDNSVTLTLREGEGTDGNMLFSTGLSTSSSTAEWISVDISGVEITQGSKYTIHLTSTSFFEEVFMWARDNTNPYQNGKSFYSNIAYTEYDLCFKTYIGTTGWVDLN